jgi:hypothetical protein
MQEQFKRDQMGSEHQGMDGDSVSLLDILGSDIITKDGLKNVVITSSSNIISGGAQ